MAKKTKSRKVQHNCRIQLLFAFFIISTFGCIGFREHLVELYPVGLVIATFVIEQDEIIFFRVIFIIIAAALMFIEIAQNWQVIYSI